MSTLHLVYAVPYPQRFGYRIINKINQFVNKHTPIYRNNEACIDWPAPIYAPYSITYNLIQAFKEVMPIKIYDWQEPASNTAMVGKEDVLLIHPTPNFEEWNDNNTWNGINENTVGFSLLNQIDPKKIFLIVPYTHDAHESPWLTKVFERYVKNVIFICGQIWMDTWHLSPYMKFPLNILRVDMALESRQYPLLKKAFNPKGKRKFLYVGTTMSYKNIGQLEQIALHVPGFEGGYISRGNIKGWNKIADYALLSPAYMAELAQEYDFFINCSSGDAQATTILEQMSFGMGVACTPESGYNYPSIFKLHVHDTNFNVQQIENMQNADEDLLTSMALENRAIVSEKHNWQVFSSSIKKFVL
jgi:hypothetical protein